MVLRCRGCRESPLSINDALLRDGHARGEATHSDQTYFVATEAVSADGTPARVIAAIPIAASFARVPLRCSSRSFGVLAAIGGSWVSPPHSSW